ncbi:BUL1 [Candida oxycetoniae]|uniref:BUL1 n=1 Tax=Candida oxycetoniae TaxID=497107 RepID=A0AAI9WWI6_9ASCO|nr:BUL1 [Candida oxycetoniae]KAI3402993.2 BUL1 [Candida oxycetoniae]
MDELSNDRTKSFEETLGTILPSYSMYTSTIGMGVNVPQSLESRDLPPPPDYLDSRSESEPSIYSGGNTATVVSSSTSTLSGNGRNGGGTNSAMIVADESTNTWEETILDNVHQIPNMTFEDHEISKAVQIEIYYTKDIGEINKVPEMIDPSLYEYKQGDLLNGYIIIRNTSNKPIPFEMFYLSFEGNYMIANQQHHTDRVPVKINKFLEMFDFSGSWNDAHINRLVNEFENPYQCCRQNHIDPLDGCYLYFGLKREILPERVYKRFFSFKIPGNLLDSQCDEHNLSSHLELPPTIGLSRWEIAHFPEREKNKIFDFSIIDTSISYGVMARFIGRKSTWEKDFGKLEPSRERCNAKLVNSKGDEYIILKELTNYVRVIPKTKTLTESEKLMKKVETKLLFENLQNRINEKIDVANRMLKSIEENNFESITNLSFELSQQELETAKLKQQYKREACSSIIDMKMNLKKKENYQVCLPVVKRSFTGINKHLGVLRITTPKQEHHVCYIPPQRFCTTAIDKSLPSWQLSFPVHLSMEGVATSNDKPFKPPTIKDIQVELAVHTMRSMTHSLAVEFDHDSIYNKKPNNTKPFLDTDTFKQNVIKPFQGQSTELYHSLKTLGSGNFKIEKQLVQDLKAICHLEEKSINLVVEELKVNGKKYTSKVGLFWSITPTSETRNTLVTATTSFDLSIDLTKLSLKGSSPSSVPSYKRFNLVPSFQSCFMARFYFLTLTITLSQNDCARIKIPVIIEKQ